MNRRVIGLGAGGHAKVIIEILQQDSRMEIVGLLDANPRLKGHRVLGVEILGGDEMLPLLISRGICGFFIGRGSVSNSSDRQGLFEMGLASGMEPVDAIHSSAIVSPSAQIGPGVTIMAGAIINAAASLGANVIVNTGAIIEHDCVVGDHAHVATGARIAGTVRVGAGAHIGAGATIRQSLTIGERAVVGAGAVVITDIFPHMIVAGVPARELKERGNRVDG